MGKLQPNFSWQKYEGKEENQKEQFQYQLQQQHILVSNSINATINDASYFDVQRQTSFTWINNQPINSLTIPISSWTSGGTVNTIPLDIVGGPTGNYQILFMFCFISSGTTAADDTLPIPYIDVNDASNDIMMIRTGDEIVLTSGGTNYSSYIGYVTVYFITS